MPQSTTLRRSSVSHAYANVEPQRFARRGMTAAEILDALGDTILGLFVMGSNPVISAPDAALLRAKLGRAEHVVVCDFFLSETATQAHVVLPVRQWAEETGTITNLEGRVLIRERCVDRRTVRAATVQRR